MKMRAVLSSGVFVLLLSGCFFSPSWQWEKAGADDAEYESDVRYCKSHTEQPAGGAVTNETVRRLHACMSQRGWRKVQR